MTTAYLMLTVLFSALGLGFIVYARRQWAGMPLISGVGLVIIPYLTQNIYILIPGGLVLIILPYFLRF